MSLSLCTMEYKTEGKETPSLTDWLIRTGLGQFEARLRQIGIKDVSSFAELDADDLNEMQINDMKCHLAQVLMSVAQYVNEKSKIVPNKQPPLFIRQDSMEPTSFSEHTDKISIAFVGSSSSGKTNLSVQFISGKSVTDHEPTLIDTYSKEMKVDGSKCQVTLVDCGQEYGENLDVASTDGFIICHKANDMASLNFALKLVDEIIAIKDTTMLLPDTKWPIFLVRTHNEQVEGGSLLMLPEKYANLNLQQYDIALGEVSYTDCCVRQMVQNVRSHRKSYSRPLEISPGERKQALIGYWVLQSVVGGHHSWKSLEFPIMELDKWTNVRWHRSSWKSNSMNDVSISNGYIESVLLSSTSFVVSSVSSQVTFNSEQGVSVSFLFAFDKDNNLMLQYDEFTDDFKLYFNWLNRLPYPDLLPVSLSSYVNDIQIPESDGIVLVSADRQEFRFHSAILNARCLSEGATQLKSKDLPYSSNVIKSLLVYLYTNAPPLSLVEQRSEYSPVLTYSELRDLAQLAEQLGLPQLVLYCNLPQDKSLQSKTRQQPSDTCEMLLHYGLEMDKVCFLIFNEQKLLKEDLLFSSARKQLGLLAKITIGSYDARCARQKVLLMLYNYHNIWKKRLLKSQKRAFLTITLQWFKDVVDRYYNYLIDNFKEFKTLWDKPDNQISSLEYITYAIRRMKKQDARVFTKNADYIKSNLEMFLEATLKSNKPKSLIHMGRNISKVFKIRKTIKTLQQLKDQLPFLAAEVIKELEFIANNDEHPDAFKRCQEFITALVNFVNSKEKLMQKFKKSVDKMSLKEWKAFLNKCGGKLNYFINNAKSLKFSCANHLWMSKVTGRPRKLGRILGVDMAWEVGILSQKPSLEFPLVDKEFKEEMRDFSDNEKYLEFHKYRKAISEMFGETISRKAKGGDKPQKIKSSRATSPTRSVIPIAGLGMELQYLLRLDCPVPFDMYFQLDDGSLLGAHSVVVCARCSWFMNALGSGMKESIDRKISLPGVSLEAAHAFIFVLYTGRLPEDVIKQPLNHVGVLAEMMCLSHRLELHDLFSVCEVKLLSCINEESVIDLLTYADGLQALLLYKRCVQFVTLHTALHNSEELKRLSPKTRTFIEGEFVRVNGHGRKPPQQLANLLKPFYFKQMVRCETYSITEVVKGSKLDTKKETIGKSYDNDTKTVSLQGIFKDLRHRAKIAQDAQQ